MKKVVSVILSVLLVGALSVSKVQAFDAEATLKASYDKVLEYYSGTSICYLDEIIALGNAGVDVKNMPLSNVYCEYDTTQDFATMGAGFLGKFIIAAIFMGDDPTNINGTDLVALLTSMVDENGVIAECINDADDYVWALFALIATDYENVDTMADVLSSYQVSVDTAGDRDNDKGGFNGAWGVSMDTVGLVIEALSLVDKDAHQESINNALTYLERKQNSDAGYDPNDEWGPSPANTDTQSCTVEGLLVYDREGVLNGMYDTADGEISDYVLAYQNEDGSFINGGWDAGTSDANLYSTFAALRALSTYFNGSFVLNANTIYNTVEEEETTPPTSTPIQPTGPNTGDNNAFGGYIVFLLLSAMVLKGRMRKYE